MKNKNGFAALVSLLVIFALFALAFAYLYNKNWFGGGVSLPSISGNSETVPAAKNAGGINNQLDTLRTDVKSLQDKKDQEIMKELN